MKIPITKAVFDEHELELLAEPLKSGWVVQGPFVRQFEEAFAAYTNSAHAIACTSCTTALHLAMVALGIGPGDEVIVPAFTWIATANAVEYVGARPVFCDIDLSSFNINIRALERVRTEHTRAIIPVHLFGLPVEMPPLLEWASQHDLNVVEDAACGFGAHSLGQHVGTFGDFGCFSFHPRKAITTGEGGMLLTQDAGLAELCRSLRDHGASKSDLSRHQGKAAFLLSEFNHLGFNYRMTDLQGAVGVAQMQKAAWIQQQRTARAKRYGQLLSPLPWLQPPQVPADMQHGFQSYVCLFAPEHPTPQNAGRLNEMRNQLMLRLENLGISTRQGTHAVTTLGYYQNKYGIRDEDFPGALLADRLSLTLPLYAQMTDSEQDYVVENLEQVFKELPCAGL